MCNFRLLRVSNLCEHRTKVVFELKSMVGWGEHKVVLDESGFSAYRVDVDWSLDFYPCANVLFFCGGILIYSNNNKSVGAK